MPKAPKTKVTSKERASEPAPVDPALRDEGNEQSVTSPPEQNGRPANAEQQSGPADLHAYRPPGVPVPKPGEGQDARPPHQAFYPGFPWPYYPVSGPPGAPGMPPYPPPPNGYPGPPPPYVLGPQGVPFPFGFYPQPKPASEEGESEAEAEHAEGQDGEYKPPAAKRAKKASVPRPPPVEGEDAIKKANIACQYCRKRKIKCDELKPRCTSCDRLGQECSYDDIRRFRGKAKATLAREKIVGGASSKRARAAAKQAEAAANDSSSTIAVPPLAGAMPRFMYWNGPHMGAPEQPPPTSS